MRQRHDTWLQRRDHRDFSTSGSRDNGLRRKRQSGVLPVARSLASRGRFHFESATPMTSLRDARGTAAAAAAAACWPRRRRRQQMRSVERRHGITTCRIHNTVNAAATAADSGGVCRRVGGGVGDKDWSDWAFDSFSTARRRGTLLPVREREGGAQCFYVQSSHHYVASPAVALMARQPHGARGFSKNTRQPNYRQTLLCAGDTMRPGWWIVRRRSTSRFVLANSLVASFLNDRGKAKIIRNKIRAIQRCQKHSVSVWK